ncbi:MAG: hypothetical protein FJX22_00400 [Alphaproteobacteria bacterium]|nr:hypothetical protein [Alphaproteobacteria bacterium]
MLSLSLTLTMPAKPAMAVGVVPTIDVKGVPVWIKQLAEQLATKLINMAMQKLMQEANKALGPVANMPLLGEILQPTLDGLMQDAMRLATSGSNDLMNNIFRSPQQNFTDCMNNFACTSNIQLSNNFTASFANPFGGTGSANTTFTVIPPSQLPANLREYGAVAGQSSSPLPFAGPPVQNGNVYTAELPNGASVNFNPPPGTNFALMTSLPANVAFTTTDATANMNFLDAPNAGLNLNVGNALRIVAPTADGTTAAPTVIASPEVRAAIKTANSDNKPVDVSGITINPNQLTIGPGGQIQGNLQAGFTLPGNIDVTAAFGAQGNPQIQANVGNALCPNLTDADKLGGKVCGMANAAVSKLLDCATGGNPGQCAQGAGKGLLVSLGQAALGDMFKKESKGDGGLQVEAGQQALFAQYFCDPNNNTPECIAQKTALRNADLVFKTTEHISNIQAWKTKFPQIKTDIDKNIAKMMEKCGGGNANCIAAAQLFQEQAYGDLENSERVLILNGEILKAYSLLPTLPTALTLTKG